MWHKNWTETVGVGQRSIFHGLVIFALYLEDYLMDKCYNWNTGSMWCKDLPKKCLWVSDLHFMVQWFCLLYWRLFDGLIFFWSYWFNDKYWTETIYVGQWPAFHGPVILPYILKTIWLTNVIVVILWYKDTMYVGQRPTFRGAVILTYILKMFWWRNVGLKILIHCDIKFDQQMYM